MLVALDRPVPRRSPAEHARRRAERLADRRLFSPAERARWLARRTLQLARLERVADERVHGAEPRGRRTCAQKKARR